MPIRPEFRHFYGPAWRKKVRPAILRRAGGKFDRKGRYLGGAKCEECGAIDGKQILRHPDWPSTWFEFPSGRAHYLDGRVRHLKALPSDLLSQKVVLVQIGVAHRNNIAGDDRPENLAAWCRGCHLRNDEAHHHVTRATRKDLARPILQAAHA